MRIQYFIVTLVICYCACQRNKTVHGMVVLNADGSTTVPRVVSAEPAVAKLVAEPKILIAPKPVEKEATVVHEKVSDSPKPKDRETVIPNVKEAPAVVKPVAEPRILIAPKPVEKEETVVREKVSDSPKPKDRETVIPNVKEAPAVVKPVAEPKILIAPKPVEKEETVVREKVSDSPQPKARETAVPNVKEPTAVVKPVVEPKPVIAPKPTQKDETVVREKVSDSPKPKTQETVASHAKESTPTSHHASSKLTTAKLVVKSKPAISSKPVKKTETIVHEKVSGTPEPKDHKTAVSHHASSKITTAKLVVKPKPVIAPKATQNEDKTSVVKSDTPQRQPKADPVAKPDISENLLDLMTDPKANLTAVDGNLKFCKTAACPMIYCENSLPPIPSQRICCQRCVTNPKCDASKCPKLNCGANVIPANLSAGECCDRCATEKPHSSAKPDHTTKYHTPKDGGCQMHPFERNRDLYKSRLFHLLNELLDQLKDEGYDDSSDSDQSHGMVMHKK